MKGDRGCRSRNVIGSTFCISPREVSKANSRDAAISLLSLAPFLLRDCATLRGHEPEARKQIRIKTVRLSILVVPLVPRCTLLRDRPYFLRGSYRSYQNPPCHFSRWKLRQQSPRLGHGGHRWDNGAGAHGQRLAASNRFALDVRAGRSCTRDTPLTR